MANFFNQDTTTIGLPARCVSHDIHLTSYGETIIIVLGKCFNHHICLRFRSGWCQNNPDSSSLERKNEILQHESLRWHCEILREWTTIAGSKTWAGSVTNLWTRYPRQAWPRGSLIIEHYRVLVGNHHRGYQSPCALIDELLILEQINQWDRKSTRLNSSHAT